RRHAAFYMETFRAAMADVNGPRHAAAVQTLQLEHDNACAALDAVTAARWFDIGLRLAKALADWWYVQGTLGDGVARLRRLLAQDPPAGVELAALLKPAGTLAVYLGDHEQAQAWFERGLA